MRILITGASGFIGGHLTQALIETGHEIIAAVRRPQSLQHRWPNIRTLPIDFSRDLNPEEWTPHLAGVDVVINAVGIIRESGENSFDKLHSRGPIVLFQACETAGVRRVLQLSALGADDQAFSHYHRSKRSADTYLKQTELDWAILMPSIVYGPGAKSMALFQAMAALPLIPLIDQGDQPIQPIHIQDLVRAVISLVEQPTTLRQDIKMVGPSPIQMKELYRRLCDWQGLGQARFLRIPYPLAFKGAQWAGLLGQTPINAEAVQMLQKGNTASVEPFIQRFGFRPRSLTQALAEDPARQADRWYAGLYFLAPLLRLSIAFLWIWTGIVSAFLFPAEQSYALLKQVGIAGIWQPMLLYGAAALDFGLGLATLFSFRLQLTGWIQIGIVLFYSLIITVWLPEQWIHPFGPMSKNLPLLVGILIMLVLERRKP